MSSNYGNVEATDISSGSTELQTELTTRSGSVTYNGPASKLILRSDYGPVIGELNAALPLHSADLNSSSGGVTLVLPASSSARVDASTSSGSIQFPDANDNGTSSSDSHRVTTMGSGEAQVHLKSNYGNVVLRTK